MGKSEDNMDNAPLAFVLSLAAGMATCLGAVVVFSPRLVKLASKRFLAGSLGISAGVMMYVSFVELFSESVESFEEQGFDEADAYLYGTLSFFGGMLIYKCIDFTVHTMERGGSSSHNVDVHLYDLDQTLGETAKKDETREAAVAGTALSNDDSANVTAHGDPVTAAVVPRVPTTSRDFPREHDVVVEISSGNTIQPSPDLHTLQISMAGKVQPSKQRHHQEEKSSVSVSTPENKPAAGGNLSAVEDAQGKGMGDGNAEAAIEVEGTGENEEIDKKLVRMGLMTALAIGIHNFPEGLATFVATLSDARVGATLAVAIAIHNIPEGLCVAIPVYYATGNRMKAFCWAFLSGISEPIGAGIGWLILKDVMTDTVFGILFGIVSGMMVIISLQELIPTAVRYDPGDKVTTNTMFIGMVVMALSIVLFHY